MSILVFPSCLESAIPFVREAKAWDQTVIGASALDNDPYKASYDAWEKLPYIGEAAFPDKLKEIVAKHGITQFYSPHVPSYLRLKEMLPLFPGLHLRGEHPAKAQERKVRAKIEAAEHDKERLKRLTGRDDALREDFMAALLADAVELFGECSREKMVALAAAFTDAPKGDVIEIGSFFGKSAYVLNRLAAYFSIGPTLAVDPWSVDTCVQKESPAVIQDLAFVWDWELVFKGFLMALEARVAPPFNYMKATSESAWNHYRDKGEITSPEFGATKMVGKIAFLHIDGNHDEAAVTLDFDLWSQALAPAAWVVFDDYEWSWGDGPKKLVARIRAEQKNRIQKEFVAGGCAFLKFA
jgi:hypothetical protein